MAIPHHVRTAKTNRDSAQQGRQQDRPLYDVVRGIYLYELLPVQQTQLINNSEHNVLPTTSHTSTQPESNHCLWHNANKHGPAVRRSESPNVAVMLP
jgi:hypothetical protein